MSEMLVAQCPHCQTRFRLSQEHLQAAAGNVRCGACLKVFNASSQAPAAPTPAAPPPAVTAAKPAPVPTEQSTPGIDRQGTLLIHDDLELDELDLEALGLDESILEEINPAAKTEPPPRPAEPLPAQPAPAKPEPEPEPEPDPSADMEPQASLTQDQAPAPEAQSAAAERQKKMDERDAQLDIDSVFDFAEDDDLDRVEPDAGSDSDLSHDDEDLDLHDAFVAAPRMRDFELSPPVEPDDPAAAEDQLFGSPIPEPMRPLIAAGRDHGIFLRDKPKETPARGSKPAEQAVTPEEDVTDPDRREPLLGSHLQLPDLIDEPLLLDERPLARAPKHRALWTSLSVLAALALAAQALLYNFEALSHNDRSRPLIEKLCLIGGCQLPARVDISLIRSSNLTVRPHAEYPNALAVDVILYNRADFAQPFPVIRMNFSDLGGRALAQRTFRPEEYLGGELAGVSLMPSQTPVHVGLSLLDPGTEVASYSLEFLSP